MPRTGELCLAFGLFIVSAGCTAPDNHAPATDVHDTAEQCSPIRECDVTKSTCQEAVLALTACIRGDDKPPLPEIRKLTSEQLGEELRAQAQANGVMDTPVDAALRAFHLLPVDVSASDASINSVTEQWAAYYDPETARVTMLDSADSVDAVDAMNTLSHEFTHYLQDLRVDLKTIDKRFGTSADSVVATRTLLEGEALVTSTRVLARMTGLSASALNWQRLFDLLDANLVDEVDGSKAPLSDAALSIPYPIGGRYVSNVWNHYDRQHVDALFDAPPRAVADWMAGYGAGKVAAALPHELECAPPQAPKGFSVYGLDGLGATGVLALLAAADAASLEIAAAVRGDAIAVYTPDDVDDPSQGPVLAVWRLRFRDSTSAEAFVTRLDPLQFTIARTYPEVVISVSSDSNLEALHGAILDGCPGLEELKPLHQPKLPMAALRALLP